MLIGSGLWDGRKHYLDKTTLGDLVRAYAAYPTIQAYVVLALIAAGAVIAQWPAPVGGVAAAVVATIAVYPLIWYLLHRYVLHGRYLYKWVGTAAMWKRIHYHHHQDPNDLGVLFGALYTTLPTITLVTLPVGWLLAGPAGSAAAFGTGMVVTCFYEFCHCIQHLAYAPSGALCGVSRSSICCTISTVKRATTASPITPSTGCWARFTAILPPWPGAIPCPTWAMPGLSASATPGSRT